MAAVVVVSLIVFDFRNCLISISVEAAFEIKELSNERVQQKKIISKKQTGTIFLKNQRIYYYPEGNCLTEDFLLSNRR